MTDEKQADLGLLIFRVALGVVFLAHGYLKVFTFGLEHAAAVFAGHSVWGYHIIPGWSAPVAAVIEWVGGIMLITGYRIKIAAPLLAAVAFGAGAVHFENGWNYTSKPDGGWEYGIFLCICCIVLYLIGPGKCTLKAYLDSRSGD